VIHGQPGLQDGVEFKEFAIEESRDDPVAAGEILDDAFGKGTCSLRSSIAETKRALCKRARSFVDAFSLPPTKASCSAPVA
jgi:hypothetical protein